MPLYRIIEKYDLLRVDYLSGTAGDQISELLEASAYNVKKWMMLKREEALSLILHWLFQVPVLAPGNKLS